MAIGSCNPFPRPSLKFRTAGFPQYGFKSTFLRDLRARRANAARLYAGHSPLAALPRVAHKGQSPQAALGRDLPGRCRSRGPWLASGLCCPTGSSLTMASSETLTPTRQLICFVWRALGGSEVPNFNLPVLSSMPPALPRRIGWPVDRWRSNRDSLRHDPNGSASASPGKSVHAW